MTITHGEKYTFITDGPRQMVLTHVEFMGLPEDEVLKNEIRKRYGLEVLERVLSTVIGWRIRGALLS